MTNDPLTLFCLVDGDSTPFSVDIDASKTVDHLKDAIKTKQSPDFDNIVASNLTLWRVSIPLVPKKDRKDISLSDVPLKEELDETDDHSDVFPVKLPKKTIHIIVQRPPPVHAPVPSRALTPLPGSLSNGSRPGTPLSDDLHANIKRITERFFTPGSDVTKFLGTFVKGVGALPNTSGSIRGLPRAWRRGSGNLQKPVQVCCSWTSPTPQHLIERRGISQRALFWTWSRKTIVKSFPSLAFLAVARLAQ